MRSSCPKPTHDKVKALFAFMMMCIMLLAGCSDGKKIPRNVVDGGIRQVLEEKEFPTAFRGVFATGKLKDFVIKNQYVKKMNDETWHIYDVDAVITFTDPAYVALNHGYDKKIKSYVGFVRRGDKWYLRETDGN